METKIPILCSLHVSLFGALFLCQSLHLAKIRSNLKLSQAEFSEGHMKLEPWLECYARFVSELHQVPRNHVTFEVLLINETNRPRSRQTEDIISNVRKTAFLHHPLQPYTRPKKRCAS